MSELETHDAQSETDSVSETYSDESTIIEEDAIIENRIIPSDQLLSNLKEKADFIGSKKFIGKKKDMMFFWGPYGLGYYSIRAKRWEKIYNAKVEKFNKLSIHKKKIIRTFVNDIKKWEEVDILSFFGMIGLKKLAFINIGDLIDLIEKESCPVCYKILYPEQQKVKNSIIG